MKLVHALAAVALVSCGGPQEMPAPSGPPTSNAPSTSIATVTALASTRAPADLDAGVAVRGAPELEMRELHYCLSLMLEGTRVCLPLTFYPPKPDIGKLYAWHKKAGVMAMYRIVGDRLVFFVVHWGIETNASQLCHSANRLELGPEPRIGGSRLFALRAECERDGHDEPEAPAEDPSVPVPDAGAHTRFRNTCWVALGQALKAEDDEWHRVPPPLTVKQRKLLAYLLRGPTIYWSWDGCRPWRVRPNRIGQTNLKISNVGE